VRLLTKKIPEEIIDPDEKETRMLLYYQNLSTNPIASIVKGLDRAHNILTMNTAGWTINKQKEYLIEALNCALPMLKKARRTFTEQRLAYENVKSLIIIQAQHIKFTLGIMKQLEDSIDPSNNTITF
jgi:hypothetical protein